MKLPEKIYLQWYGDGEPDEPGEVSVGDVTWCKDKIFKHDIEYVIAARIADLEALVKRHEATLEWLADTPNFDSLHKNWKSRMYALCRIGDNEGTSTAMPTPLEAIEAAMKEEKP